MISITTLAIITIASLSLFIVIGMAIGSRRERNSADYYLKELEEFKRKNKEAEANGEPLFCAATKKPSENLYREVLNTTTQVAESKRITDNSDFALSMAVAAATDSTILGVMAGGDMAGAVIGDMLNDSDEEPKIDHGYSDDSADYSDHSDDSHEDHSDSGDYGSSDYSSSDSSDSSSTDY